MAENRSRTNLHTLIAIAVASTAHGGPLAQAIADGARRLPGTATATVAYIDQRIEARGEATRRQSFFMNLKWHPDDGTPVAWSQCGSLVRDAVTAATVAGGGRLVSFDLVSPVLWRHLLAGADGVALSSPLVPRRTAPVRHGIVVENKAVPRGEQSGLADVMA